MAPATVAGTARTRGPGAVAVCPMLGPLKSARAGRRARPGPRRRCGLDLRGARLRRARAVRRCARRCATFDQRLRCSPAGACRYRRRLARRDAVRRAVAPARAGRRTRRRHAPSDRRETPGVCSTTGAGSRRARRPIRVYRRHRTGHSPRWSAIRSARLRGEKPRTTYCAKGARRSRAVRATSTSHATSSRTARSPRSSSATPRFVDAPRGTVTGVLDRLAPGGMIRSTVRRSSRRPRARAEEMILHSSTFRSSTLFPLTSVIAAGAVSARRRGRSVHCEPGVEGARAVAPEGN